MSVTPLIRRGTPRDKAPERKLRGDAMSGDRYLSREFMQLEWDHMWTRTWQIGGWAADLVEPGDFMTHKLGRESILMVRQEDGLVRAFYNVCQHRGNRLVHGDLGHAKIFTCSYHGWQFARDGMLVNAQDPDDFPQGNPCGKVKLSEIPCETWGGFVWFNMDANAAPLRKFMNPITEQLDCYGMDKMVRVVNLTALVECNWKIIQDNFNESYHLPTIHKELSKFVNEDYKETRFDLYPSGHCRMMIEACIPSARDGDPMTIGQPLDAWMSYWGLDPTEFAGRGREARSALQQAKRRLGLERGYTHYEGISDEQLTDYYHYTIFPNLSLTMSSDGFQVLRPLPHPTDPEKCYFDHWFIVPKVEGVDTVETPIGILPVEEAPNELINHGDKSLGFVADQDLSIAVGQQLGLASRGFKDAYLSGQESRVRYFHENLNDYISGRR